MSSMLRVEGLSGGYGKEAVIKGVSFEVKRGDFLGIIGPNGSGKSTLLRLMSRALLPQGGEVFFIDREITRMRLKELCRKVAFVPQDTVINFSFSIWEIVLMGRIPHLKRLQHETENDFAVAKQALVSTDSFHLRGKRIDELSAGERQRVIVAKALTQEPLLLLLDEPTSHLDIGYQIEILDLLKRLNRENHLTVVVVLHDLNLALEYCQRIILLNEGRIFTSGSPQEVVTSQNIESVYKTRAVVRKDPESLRPYVILVSKEK